MSFDIRFTRHGFKDACKIPEAEPGKLDIKRREPGIRFIILTGSSNWRLGRNYRCSCRFNVIDDVIKKEQRHDDLIEAHAVR